MTGPVSFGGTLQRQDWQAANCAAVRGQRRVALLLYGCAGLAFSWWGMYGQTAAVTGAAFFLFAWKPSAPRSRRDFPDWEQPMQVDCDEAGVSTAYGRHQRKWRWGQLDSLIETPGHFVLVFPGRTLLPLPKSWMSYEKRTAFRSLATTELAAASKGFELQLN